MLPLVRYRVEDPSMEPAMAAGDYVIVNRWAYRLGEPAKGDLVVLRDPENKERHLVKRVADVVNGGVFVVGDNLERSRDSRRFGPVPKSLLIGRVWRHARP